MAIPVLLKGDTGAEITFTLGGDINWTGCSLRVRFCNVEKTIEDISGAGDVSVSYTAKEMRGFRLGTSKVFFTLITAAGETRPLPWAKIKVTDSPGVAASAPIVINPEGGGGGDASHMLDGVTIPEYPTQLQSADVLKTIVRTFGGTVQ